MKKDSMSYNKAYLSFKVYKLRNPLVKDIIKSLQDHYGFASETELIRFSLFKLFRETFKQEEKQSRRR